VYRTLSTGFASDTFDRVARLPRNALPDGLFHITARAGFDQLLFLDDEDRRVFVSMLHRCAARFAVELLAYCLMGTHYHLLLEGRGQDLASTMQRLNGGYAHHFNSRHDRHGHVFGQRYTTRVVLDESHLEKLWEYIEQNPYEAGLCPPEERWPWMWFRPPVSASGQAEACP
jgi:putative transposase